MSFTVFILLNGKVQFVFLPTDYFNRREHRNPDLSHHKLQNCKDKRSTP